MESAKSDTPAVAEKGFGGNKGRMENDGVQIKKSTNCLSFDKAQDDKIVEFKNFQNYMCSSIAYYCSPSQFGKLTKCSVQALAGATYSREEPVFAARVTLLFLCLAKEKVTKRKAPSASLRMTFPKAAPPLKLRNNDKIKYTILLVLFHFYFVAKVFK